MQIIDIDNIKRLEVDSNSLYAVKEEDSLKLYSNISASIIDKNFYELDERISDIEAQIRLRFDGELIRCKNEIEELKNRITELEKYIKIDYE